MDGSLQRARIALVKSDGPVEVGFQKAVSLAFVPLLLVNYSVCCIIYVLS